MILIEAFDLLKEFEDGSGDESCIVLIRLQVFKEGVLLLFGFGIFRNCIFPVAAEHGVGLSGARLAIREHSQVIPLGDLRNVLREQVEEILLVGRLRHRLVELYRQGGDCVCGYINGFALGIKQ